MADIDTGGGGHGKGDGKVRSKKMATKIDFTPMVDLGFLLITFFVFTTTMSQATAMNMNEPKDDPTNQLKVKNSGVMTLLLGKSDQVYYYMGELTDPNKQFKSSNFKDIRQVILDKKNATPIGDLMYIIKTDKEATFKNAIDVLDEMSINAVPPGHYAEVDMSDTEAQLIKATETANGIK